MGRQGPHLTQLDRECVKEIASLSMYDAYGKQACHVLYCINIMRYLYDSHGGYL